MDEENVNTLLEKLDEIIFWLKISNLQPVREHLEGILDSDQKRVVYQNSDGKTTAEIAEIAGLGSNKTVANWWDEWLKHGIVTEVSSGRGSKKVRIINLKEIGLL